MTRTRLKRLARRGGQAVTQRIAVCAEKAAAGVADDEDLFRPKQLLADDQRADDVIGGESARIPDDVRLPGPQPEGDVDLEPRVHAGDDREDGAARRPVRDERSNDSA